MEPLAALCVMSAAMFVGSFFFGYLPLIVSWPEARMRFLTTVGTGMLVGTALLVVIPEGIHTIYGVHSHGGGHDHAELVPLRPTGGVQGGAFVTVTTAAPSYDAGKAMAAFKAPVEEQHRRQQQREQQGVAGEDNDYDEGNHRGHENDDDEHDGNGVHQQHLLQQHRDQHPNEQQEQRLRRRHLLQQHLQLSEHRSQHNEHHPQHNERHQHQHDDEHQHHDDHHDDKNKEDEHEHEHGEQPCVSPSSSADHIGTALAAGFVFMLLVDRISDGDGHGHSHGGHRPVSVAVSQPTRTSSGRSLHATSKLASRGGRRRPGTTNNSKNNNNDGGDGNGNGNNTLRDSSDHLHSHHHLHHHHGMNAADGDSPLSGAGMDESSDTNKKTDLRIDTLNSSSSSGGGGSSKSGGNGGNGGAGSSMHEPISLLVLRGSGGGGDEMQHAGSPRHGHHHHHHHHHHHGDADHTDSTSIGLLVHAAVDGVALGAVSFTHSGSLEFIVFLAIMMHKAPAAFGITSYLIHARKPASEITKQLTMFSAAAPVMALATFVVFGAGLLDPQQTRDYMGLCLLFSAGTFLYVATVHILPEIQHAQNDAKAPLEWPLVWALVGGIMLPMFLAVQHEH
eukprot:TRINITY_DN66852_c1_g4_i1.p1 TRINITY_DN66852_c1_g4~~TRINITY_DN66852_c1_g4_i1.p1  ORF type:complete len:618 (+),score=293.35 TRINITY_DN66852_c1_g4_i1:108-1961(+)